MFSIKVAKSAANTVSELTLKQASKRAFTFLTAVNANGAIRNELAAKVKFTKAREDEGWALLEALRKASVAATPQPENQAIEGMAACEAWQSTGLVQVRTMLEMTSPEQALFLFHDFVPGKGMAAVFNVETFFDRLDQLAHGPERKASRKADAQALHILDEIGITKETLKEVGVMVNKAHSAQQSVATDPTETEVQQEERIEAMRQIHAWVTTWSEMARTVIKRRDQMIQLGIAKRRPKTKAAIVPPVITSPVVTAPTTPVTPTAPPANDNGPESHAA